MSAVHADSQRTNFTVENQFPRWEQFEVGLSYEGSEADTDSTFTPDSGRTTAFVRYGILDNLAVKLDIPYVNYELPNGISNDGIGDMEVEFQLLTYEDIFGYPYFIPHASFSIPTGDEDEGLGQDGIVVTFGVAYGSTINDWIDWVLDATYVVNPDVNDQILVANSYVWNISEEFGLVTEIMYREAIIEGEDSTVIATGGFTYDWTESLQLDISVGGGLTGPTDAYGKAGLSYTF
ncbi:transporter [Kiritimatiellaeota bacterium B1221]|nr:transporter [Kiritimatiellaeota bacterium B1221]